MKCPMCNGKGTQFIADYDGMYDIVCEQCKGKGEVDENGKPIFTNEEYLRSLNTEQLAEWFGDWHSFSCVFCKHWQNGCIYNHNQVRCAIEEGKSNKELWVEWLKQPHTEKE